MPKQDVESAIESAKMQLRAMATPEFNREVKAQICSRKPLVYLVTNEEKRVLEYFRHFALAGNYRTFCWDCYSGILNITDMTTAAIGSVDASDVEAVLDFIVKEATETHEADKANEQRWQGNVYVMLDFHRFLKPCPPPIERRLRTLARMNCRTTLILVAPSLEMTSALDKDITVLDFPFPNQLEIKDTLNTIVESIVESGALGTKEGETLQTDTKNREDEIVRSVGGLTLSEVDAALSKSVVLHRRFDVETIIKEKQQVIRKTGVLEFYNPDVGVEDVGGLSNLTNWLKKRKKAFETDASEYGLPLPKGIMIFGIPGCVVGKTKIRVRKTSNEGLHTVVEE